MKKLTIDGRKPFTINLKVDVIDKFKIYCDKEGFLPSRRIEVLMKEDIKKVE